MFGVLFVASVIAALSLRSIIFAEPMVAWGDDASNGLLILEAKRFSLLEGHYSRTGTNHPGPGWLYLLAGGEALFYDWLHIVPAPFNAVVLAQIVIQCLCIAAVGGVATALTRRAFAGIFIGAATFWGFVGWFGDTPFLGYALGNTWPPFASFTFLAPVVAFSIAVAYGRTAFLPGLVLAGGLLVHTHVAFFFVFGGLFVGVSIAWFVVHRRGVGAELKQHRVAAALAAIALVLVIGPLVLRTILDWPNPWQGWFGFTRSVTVHPGWGEIAQYFLSDLMLIGIPVWVYGAAAAVAALLLVVERDAARRRLAVTAYSVIGVIALLSILYVKLAVDYVSPVEVYGYIVVYTLVLPPIFLSIVLVHLVGTVTERVKRAGGWRAVRVAVPILSTVAAIALFGSITIANPTIGYALQPQIARMAQIGDELAEYARANGEVGIYLRDGSLWPDFATVFLAALRNEGVGDVCGYYAEGSDAQRLTMSSAFACDGTPENIVELIRADSADSATALWSHQSDLVHPEGLVEWVPRS
ncbi:hypothetical protein ACLQ2Q_01185 [Microbacterium sp. DT81.1]|uniref:hypothetical protein n=1 Tax=Microbacterium sp. DT81.1 TaxID=3393413 RepID=UPI003CF325C1